MIRIVVLENKILGPDVVAYQAGVAPSDIVGQGSNRLDPGDVFFVDVVLSQVVGDDAKSGTAGRRQALSRSSVTRRICPESADTHLMFTRLAT